MQQGFGQSGCIYQKRYVISIDGIRNNSSKVSSASLFFQCEAIFFSRDSTPLSAAPRAPGEHSQDDSGFHSYPSRPEGYLVKTWCERQQLWKAVITGDTATRLSEVVVNHLKTARGEILPKRSEKNKTTKTTKMRTKVCNKINNQIKKVHLKKDSQ